tara:strand:+ start:401 stop:682 length:282 start_codon:yes stop_codon:yes gene_type:complete
MIKTPPWTDTPVLDDADKKLIAKISANGKSLIAYLSSDKVNMRDLKKVIIYEYEERPWKREYILNRAFSRLGKLQRSQAERSLSAKYYKNGGI